MIKTMTTNAIIPLKTSLFFLIRIIIDFIFLYPFTKSLLIYLTFPVLFFICKLCLPNYYSTFSLISRFSYIMFTDSFNL